MIRKYRAALLLFGFFVLSIAAHAYAEWRVFVAAQQAHGEAVTFAAYAWEFLSATLENWQSEMLQLALPFLMLAGAISWAKVYEEDTEQKHEAIMRRLDRIEGRIVNK